MKKLTTALFFTIVLALGGYAQSADAPAAAENRPLKITSKPQVSRDAAADCVVKARPRGLTVRLKVILHESGKVSDATVSKSSYCKSFDEAAITAAKNIKYDPQIKNGVPITVTRSLEYTYRRR